MRKGRNSRTGAVAGRHSCGVEEVAGNHKGEEIHAGSWELNQARLGPVGEFGP